MRKFLFVSSACMVMFGCSSGQTTTSGTTEAKPSSQPAGVHQSKPVSKDSMYRSTKIEPKEAPKPGKGPR